MADQNNSTPTISLTLIEKTVGILIMFLTGWAAFQSSNVKDTVALQALSIERLKAEISREERNQATVKLNHDITIKIFDEISDIYKTPNQNPDVTLNRLLAASALVEAIREPEVRKSMASAIKVAVDNVSATVVKPSEAVLLKSEAVKNKVDLTVFRADQEDSTNSQIKDETSLATAALETKINDPKWSNYDFDIFWCETSASPESSKNIADKVFELRNLDKNATGRWRVRKLPSEINNKPGYHKEGYLINVNSDDEKKIATVLQGLLKKNVIPSQDVEFQIKGVTNFTPWYISVFICPQH